MGGGGGIDPISVISSVVFGVVKAAAGTETRAQVEAASAAAEDDAAERAEAAAAEARRAAARKKAEAELLADARKAERAGLAGRDAQAQTLGAPSVAGANLKEKLGQ